MQSSTNLQKARRFRFLRAVFWLGLTAFGGPQMHLPYFKRRLVDKLRFLSQEELIEINAFCSLLPGPSTTQTITSIGLKIGGVSLAIQTLILWALPGALIMGALALSPSFLGAQQLEFLATMVVGFLVFAVWSMSKWLKPSAVTWVIFILTGAVGFFWRSPFFFPIGVIIAAIASARFGNFETTQSVRVNKSEIKWKNLSLIFLIFFIVGGTGLGLSNYAKNNKWLKPVVFFENTYRMGAISFGGGNVLAAMTAEQYVHHTNRMEMKELNTGLGMIQATPGPNYNLAVFTNAVAMKNAQYQLPGQVLGAIIGWISVFLPGLLFVLFAYPIWEKLRNWRVVQQTIPGIFAVSVGFILTAALIFGFDLWNNLQVSKFNQWEIHLGVLLFTILALASKKIPTPFIVLITLVIGWFFT